MIPYRVSRRDDDYPTWIGLVFVFNLIVGTGALTLPAVFARAGWLLGLIVISVLAFISYVTVTFIIETMACANAVIQMRRLLRNGERTSVEEETESESPEVATATTGNEVSDTSTEHKPLVPHHSRFYVLDNKVELGEMAGLFFNDFGRILFYLCIAIYLYGDLSIYSAAVSKTLRDVICSANSSANGTSDSMDADPCWEDHTLTRLDVYRLSLIAFVTLLGPFAFFNVQKTKYIQMFTVLLRWLAFTIMISIAIYRLVYQGVAGHPQMANIVGLPSLFGACVYSFMCHHSLPSILAPIRDKRRIKTFMSMDYSIICSFYLLLALTGAFAFDNLEDLYTLNFVPSADQTSVVLKVIEYFLTLFPVFTLSTSFPIIAITLRNNLQTWFLDMSRFDSYNFVQRRLIFPILTISPPIIVTFFTESITNLVGFTGSYAGTTIQYLIPIALVYSARRTCRDYFGQAMVNKYRSPFKSSAWLLFVLLWSCACIILVTINFFMNIKTEI